MTDYGHYSPASPNPVEPEPGAGRGKKRALIVGASIGVVAVAAVAAAIVIPGLSEPEDADTDAAPTAVVDQDRDAQDIDALTSQYLSILGSNGGPDGLAPVRCAQAIERAEKAPQPTPFPDGTDMVVAEKLTQNFYGPDHATARVVVGATVDGAPSLGGGDGTILGLDYLRENGTWKVCRVDPQ
ncbi:hypothetical protein CH275_16245 [Rhodococcus sp. 06-235-1A]|uniref:hypothetical protein n=1 Tax=Rhodococcus sp. 06-235-1A TaxID=2022508 RepID=UPI000B9A8A76|nr:hypothetical protein [Rhodococcus sp. 06-235-1A]OZD03935.1 hypothetical protein CH275_16245 [Rhodococcus sp. 06-235-1A]